MVSRIMAHKVSTFQVLDTVNMLPHMAKWTLQMRLRILGWGEWPGLSRWAQFNHKDPYKGKRETGDTESEEIRQRMSQTNNVDSIWRVEKARQPLTEAPEGTELCWHYDLQFWGLLISRALRVPLALFVTTTCVVTCFSSNNNTTRLNPYDSQTTRN